jgi:dihydrodipicolinate synthase/N-acetylneuraminate lyase
MPFSRGERVKVAPRDTSWAGIFPAICTTFTPDGALDLEAQRAVVHFVLAGGADGIVCFGLAGEVNKLTPDERKRLATVILAEVDGRVPVLLGVGTEAVHTSIDLARFAEAAGASGIVVPPPITAHLPGDELVPYFCAIAAATTLPVVIQDAPAYLGIGSSPAAIRKCAEAQPNIRYVKVETGPEGTARWVSELSPRIGVFTGGAGLNLLDDLRVGAVGNVPGTELTDLLVAIYRARRQGRLAAAEASFRRLLPYLVFSLQDIDHYNACTKEILLRRGILALAGLRQPAPRLSPLALELLDAHAAELALSGSASPALASGS